MRIVKKSKNVKADTAVLVDPGLENPVCPVVKQVDSYACASQKIREAIDCLAASAETDPVASAAIADLGVVYLEINQK